MPRHNKTPNLTEKLAATLLEYQRLRGDPFDRDQAKMLSAEQIVSLYEFDHAVLDANGGSNHFTNITPLLIAEHQHKTATQDVPAIRKGQRLAEAKALHDDRMRAKLTGVATESNPTPCRKIPSRPFPKRCNPWPQKPASHRWPKRKFDRRPKPG